MKRAVVSGIGGQDGSYLAEFLLEKGYDVHGIVRRPPTSTFENLAGCRDRITLHQADMTDVVAMHDILAEVQPDEVYNLAAQTFVPASWTQPFLTFEVTAIGAVKLLAACKRACPQAKFYQASSSEMFGNARPPQNEDTPLLPASPYGCAKLLAHAAVRAYRDKYGLFACSGICFNHECVTAETPVFVRRNGIIDVLPIEDVVPHRTSPRSGTRYTSEPAAEERLEVWDSKGWVKVTCMTATWNGSPSRQYKSVQRIAARGAVYHATCDHVVFTQHEGIVREKPAGLVEPGHSLALIPLPELTLATNLTKDEAWFLGFLTAEGHVSKGGRVGVTNQDEELLDKAAEKWRRVCGGDSSRYVAPSGFESGSPVTQLRLTGDGSYGRCLREWLYTRSGHKKIPVRVLNSNAELQLEFLRGYNAGDGLKSTPCVYEFQGFKTSSAVLAAGLYWLTIVTLKQRAIICTEERDGNLYYQINLNSPESEGRSAPHLRRPLEQVVKAAPISYRGWLFDLATESGTFHAGIGQGWIHNSPRRGREFVTRKVCEAVARIKLGLQKTLELGNLEARRDWGYAPYYVKAMWLMLQQDKPDDYVIATGISHSVQTLVKEAFMCIDLDWKDHLVVKADLLRKNEIHELRGDASRAKAILKWEPETSFRQMVRFMVNAELERAKK